MTCSGDKSRLEKEEFPASNRRRSVVWILVAFGFLIVGLAGGTAVFALKREWAWTFPIASFGAYLFAFRRGLLLWNPAVDRTWRHYLWLDHGVAAEDEETSRGAGEDPEETPEIPRRKTPRPSRHELRVVR